MQILQCVAMNVTLIYALLAYSSIKQRDFSGVYVGDTSLSCTCVYKAACPRWCSRDLGLFMCGLLSALSLPTSLPGVFHSCLSWPSTLMYRTLPIPLVMIPFGVIAQQYKIVEKANTCSCWWKTLRLQHHFSFHELGVCPSMEMFFHMRKLALKMTKWDT